MRLAQWTSIISECNRSGMSKKSWITANNIDEKQFYYWQRRIRQEAIQELQPTSLSSPTFIELPSSSIDMHTSKQPDAVLRIGGCSLEISNTLSPLLLQTILQVMTHA
ncbi:MAG: hypothetical protein PHD07_07755 [Bacteroidales bacterium]|nr:hypothetical protein [Bacteroidales bacterium]